MVKVLVASPHSDIRTEMLQALETKGIQGFEADSGGSAMAMVEAERPDITVLETGLRNPDAILLVDPLRHAPWAKDLKIVLAGPELWEGGAQADSLRALKPHGLLALPCRRSTFLSLIESLLPARPPAIEGKVERLAALVDGFYKTLDRKNYFELLMVEPDATEDEVRAAFQRRSMLLHPDRHQALKGTPIFSKITAIYKRLNEAYTVLGNPVLRQRYLEVLADGGLRLEQTGGKLRELDPESTIKDHSALKFFRRGRDALEQGDLKAARMHLLLAKSREPGNPAIIDTLARVERALRGEASPPPAASVGLPSAPPVSAGGSSPSMPTAGGGSSPSMPTVGGGSSPSMPTVGGGQAPSPARPPTPLPVSGGPFPSPPPGGLPRARPEVAPPPPAIPLRPGAVTPIPATAGGAAGPAAAPVDMAAGVSSGSLPVVPAQAAPSFMMVLAGGCGEWSSRTGVSKGEGIRRAVTNVRELLDLALERRVGRIGLLPMPDMGEPPPGELTDAILDFLLAERPWLLRKGIRLEFDFGPDVDDTILGRRAKLEELAQALSGGAALVLEVRLGQNGRASMVEGIRTLARAVADGKLDPEDIDGPILDRYLAGGELPDMVMWAGGTWMPGHVCPWKSMSSRNNIGRYLWPDCDRETLGEVLDGYGALASEA